MPINQKNQLTKLTKPFTTLLNAQKTLLMNYRHKQIMLIMIYKASKTKLMQEINLLKPPLMVLIHHTLL